MDIDEVGYASSEQTRIAVLLTGFTARPFPTLLSLDENILAGILSFLNPQDALQLAMTCRCANRIAMPRYLSEVELFFGSSGGDPHILEFCSYMLADISRRILCMQIFRLKRYEYHRGRGYDHANDVTFILSLAEVLRHATNLKEIHLSDTEELFATVPSFVDAWAALPHLDVIHLWNPHKYAFRLLAKTASCPRKLFIGGSDRPQAGDHQAFRNAAVSHTFTRSLQYVDLQSFVDWMNEVNVDNPYSSVQVLKISGSVVDLSAFSCAFPNVRSIQLSGAVSYGSVAPSATWSNLDYLQIDGRQNLPVCLVRRLELTYSFNRASLLKVLPALQWMCPVVLSLSILDPGFEELLQVTRAAPAVRFMRLEQASPDESWTVCIILQRALIQPKLC